MRYEGERDVATHHLWNNIEKSKEYAILLSKIYSITNSIATTAVSWGSESIKMSISMPSIVSSKDSKYAQGRSLTKSSPQELSSESIIQL